MKNGGIAMVDVKAFEEATEEFKKSLNSYNEAANKHLKGYMFDSLVYRYELARHGMSEIEREEDLHSGKRRDPDYYKDKENRDIMRFIQILDEAIGEHD